MSECEKVAIPIIVISMFRMLWTIFTFDKLLYLFHITYPQRLNNIAAVSHGGVNRGEVGTFNLSAPLSLYHFILSLQSKGNLDAVSCPNNTLLEGLTAFLS